jgi:hypothetical protein
MGGIIAMDQLTCNLGRKNGPADLQLFKNLCKHENLEHTRQTGQAKNLITFD